MAEFIHSDPVIVNKKSIISNINIPMVCPEHGAFIGWKLGYYYGEPDRNGSRPIFPALIKLEIPVDAKRSSAFGRKCRCDKAKVLEIENYFNSESIKCAFSYYDRSFVYTKNKEVSVSDFDENRWHECAPGIHFFMTRIEAENYLY